MNNRLYTIQEVANILRVSTKTLRRWDQRGRFVPTRTAGNQRRYTQEQIDKFKVQSSKLKTVPSMGLGSEAKPLFNQSVPKETKANISLPSILSGFPSGSFLKHHFLLKRKEEVESKEDPEKVFKSSVPYQEKLVGVSKVSLARPVKMGLKFAGFVTLLSLVLSLALTSYLGAAGVNGKNNQILSFLNNLSQFKDKSQSENSKFMAQNYNQAVLAASIGDSKLLLNINVPSIFSEIATFSAGLMTDNQDINAGTGILTASNVLYGLTAGAGISAGAGQTPIITNTGVLSVGGQSGVVALTAGTDISITGVTINDKSTLSSVRGRGGCDGCIVDNDVVNTITISSSGNVSGTAITSGTVGITVGGTGLTSYTTGDILYASGTDTLAKLPIGTSGQALIASSDGVPAWSSGVSALVTLEESNVTVNNAGTLNFLGGDFDLSESPAGQANIQLATTLTTALGVAGNWDVAGILTAGTADAFQVSSAGTITIPVTEDIVFGTVGLNDVGISSVTSGASRVGVYDELANSSGTNLQAVLNDLDAAIGAGSSKWSQSTGFIYLANETDDVVIGGSTVAGANFFFDESASSLYIGTNESANGVLTLYSSGAGITDPALTTDSSGNLLANSANFNVTTTGINSTAIGQTTAAAGSFTTLSATGDVTLNDAGADSILIGAAADTVTVTSNELSLTDNQWSVSVAGAAAFASVNSGSGTIQTTGSVLGNAFDRSTSGALTIGDTNASSVSICNSASCDILTLANNADADTITFGDDLDTFSLSSTGLDVTSAGALSGITTIITSGAINTATITGGTLSGGSVSGGSLSGTTLVGTGSFTVTGGTGASETLTLISTSNGTKGDIQFFSGANKITSAGNLTVAGTISSAATSNQIVLQSTGITGTLSWTPTGSNKAITFPDASGTVAVSASSPIALSAAGAISCTTCLSTVTSFAGDVSGTYDNLQLGTGVATTTEILNDTITATDLNGTLTFADGDYLDLSAILHDDSSPQGLRLPNTGAAPSSPSGGEGYIAYDTITDVIKYYDGSNWIQVSSGTGASKWTDGGATTYLTLTTDDLAVGGTDPTASPFGIDESANTVYIGEGSNGNGAIAFKASNAATGNLAYNTSDQFQFSGGDALFDQALTTTGTLTTNGALNANSTFTLGNGGSTGVINTSDWGISATGDMTNIGAITMNGNFSQTDSSTFSSGTGAVSLNGTTTVAANSSLYLAAGTGKLGVGTTTPDGKLQVTGAVTGKALTILNETGDQNILTASASGVTVANLTRAGGLNLTAGQGIDVLSAGILALGSTTATTVNLGNSAATTIAIGAGGALTRTINIGTGTGADTINIGTGGTGVDAIAIGGNTGNIVLDGTNFDLTAAGAVTLTGHLVLSSDAGEGLSGGGLTDCDDGTNSKLLWDATFNKFSCGTDGGAGAGTSKWTDSGAITWLTETSDNLTVGANNTLVAPFSVNVGANTVRIGDATAAGDAVVSLFANGGATGNLTYNSSDQFQFSGGNILFDQNLVAGSATSLVDLSAITHANSTAQGLKLPQAATLTDMGVNEGFIAYDNDDNALKFYDGSSWVTVSSGTGSSKWTLSGNVLYPNTVANQLGIGTATAGDVISSLYVTRALSSGALGKAVAVFNQTEMQDILTASASGTTQFTVGNTGNVALEGQLSDITDATLTVNDSLSVLGGLTLTGTISDSDSNLVLDDTVDIGSASNGIRIDTSGNILDIDGNLILNDQTDIGSATTGIRIDTSGNIIDIDGNLVLNDQTDIGSTTTGARVTTAGAISDIDGNLSLSDDTDVTGLFSVSGRTTLGSATPGAGKLTVTGAETGKALVILNETGDQNILTASASGTPVFNLTRAGAVQAADLVLGYNDASATITTSDTETLTIDPAGTGSIAFHTANSTNTLDSSGNLTVAGTISSAATSNQIVLQSTGITGTLSWTPTGSNKAITFPDANGTVAVSASSPIALSAAGAISCTTCLSTVTSFAGDVSGTYDNLQLGTGVVTTTEILNDTITATDLNASLTLADADYLDLSAILHDDSSPQGLRLPNTGATPSSPSGGEGYIAYDTVTDVIKYYDGSNWIQVSSGTGASKWTDGAGALPTYLTVTSDDLAVGGTDSSSEFYFDIQNGGNFAITSLADTESAMSVIANSLTTGKALSVTGTNTATTNTALQGGLFNFTNAQTTTANTNGITGLGVNFTNNPGIAGNTEYAVRVQNQATTNNTDNAVSALLLLDNADTSDTGSTVITDALKITNSGNISGGVTNAINIDDTDVTNDIVLQNDEIISNDTDGTISLNPTTLLLSGTSTITAASLATLTTAATLAISGDVTISGGDLTVGSSAALSDAAGVLTLANVDVIDSTTESTLEGAIDIAGDVTGTGLTGVTVGKINGATLGTTTATTGNLLIADGASWISTAMGGDATINSSGTLAIAANAVALGTDTTNNYVATVAGGSGVSVSGSGSETAAVSLALGALSADWNQTGAFDIRLNNASSELRILESAGDTYYGSIDVTDLSGDRTYTFPDATGTVCLSTGNCSGGGSAVNGSGTALQLAYWSDSDSLTSDDVLQIDAVNNVLGIGLGAVAIDTGAQLDFYGESEFLLLRPADIAADADTNNSSTLRFRGTYDSDVAVGPYASSNYNFDVKNTMTAAGSSPTSRLGFLNNAGAEVVSILSGGNVGIGTTNPGALLDLGLAGTTLGVLRLAGSSTGNVSIQPAAAAGTWTLTLPTIDGSSDQFLQTDGNGITAWATVNSSNWDVINGAITPKIETQDLLIGGTSTASANFRVTGNAAFAGTTSAASVSARTSFAGFVVDNTGIGDLFTASKSGATKFVINNNGNLQFAGTTNFLTTLASAATAAQTITFPDATGTVCLSSANCAFDAFWNSSSGALYPGNSTMDLLIGGASTASAKFGFINVAGGNPTATISGNLSLAVPTAAGANTFNLFNNSTLNFQRSPGGDAGLTSTLFLGSNGYVGIGTAVPGSLLTLANDGWLSGISTSSGVTNMFKLNAADQIQVGAALNIDGSYNFPTDGGIITAMDMPFSTTGTNAYVFRMGTTNAMSIYGESDASGVASNLRVGIGTIAPLATLDVRGLSGITPVASISGQTSFASLLVDNTGIGDLFTASKSGAPKFVITNAGNVGIGTAAPSALLSVGSTSQFQVNSAGTVTAVGVNSGSGLLQGTGGITITGTGNINATGTSATNLGNSTGALTLASGGTSAWTNTSGNLTISTATSGTLALTSTGALNLSAGSASTWTLPSSTTALNIAAGLMDFDTANSRIGIGTITPLATLDIRGLSGITPAASVSAQSSFASMLVDNTGIGDLFTASKSGAVKFVIGNNGNLQFAGTTNFLTTLASAATAARTITFPDATGTICLSSANCAFDAFWNSSSGALYPGNTTMDLLIGGTATSSAIIKLAGLNVNGNTLLDVFNSGSSVFNVSANQINNNVPTSFNAAGDVSMAYDLQFTNPTASYIKSYGPLYIQSGDPNQNLDLTLSAAGTGNVVINDTFLVQDTTDSTTAYQFNNAAGTTIMNIDTTNSYVGIGTTTPLLKLDVQDAQTSTAAAQIYNTFDSTTADGLIVKLGNTSTSAVASTNHFVSFETSGIGIVGSIQGNGAQNLTYATNGIADLAEYFKKDQNQVIPFGSVVCLNDSGLVVACDNNSNRIVGVASEHPTFLGGENLGDRSIAVGLVGQVYTRVSSANGAIKIGDPLTTSGIAGVAVKATSVGQILGKAIEGFDPSAGSGQVEGKILVSVNITWYNPSIYVSYDGTLEGMAATVGSIGDQLALQGETLQNLQASSSAELNYVLATDPLFDSLNNKVTELQSKVDLLSLQVDRAASISTFLMEIQNGQVLGASTSAVLDLGDVELNNATISNNLNVLGRTTVTDLGVTGNINAGVLAIHGLDGEINTLAGDLYLQKNGIGGVDILAGKVVIDTAGNMTVAGTLTADTVAANNYSVLGDQSIGSASISAGLTFVEVSTPVASGNSKIFLTATSLTDKQLTVVKKSDGKFKVAIPAVTAMPITFDWWIVGNK